MSGIEEVQKLREETGAGVMSCKKALDEAGGDMKKAAEILKKKGLEKADKKANRIVGAGIIDSYIHNNRVGVLLQLNCETDFVARSKPFIELSHNLTMQIAAMSPEDVEQLLSQAYIKDEKMTVEELIKGVIAIVGENIKVEKFSRFEL